MTAPNSRLLTRELAIRVITGVIVGPLVLVLVVLGSWPFLLALFLTAVLAISEFYGIVHTQLSRISPQALLWRLAGFLYVGFPLGVFAAMRLAPQGLTWVLTLLLANWSTDSFAYIGGHLFGKHPLAPHVSPHKTIEGAVVGIALGVALTAGANLLTQTLTVQTLAIVILTAPSSVAGDLLESVLKRQFNVKDSGNILPGHGGILDRIDGMLLACAVVGLFLIVTASL